MRNFCSNTWSNIWRRPWRFFWRIHTKIPGESTGRVFTENLILKKINWISGVISDRCLFWKGLRPLDRMSFSWMPVWSYSGQTSSGHTIVLTRWHCRNCRKSYCENSSRGVCRTCSKVSFRKSSKGFFNNSIIF